MYIWRYWKNGKPFYVGKGKKSRARNKTNRSKEFKEIIENNHCFYEIYRDNLSDIDALRLENDLINEFREKGYRLVNVSSRHDSRSIF